MYLSKQNQNEDDGNHTGSNIFFWIADSIFYGLQFWSGCQYSLIVSFGQAAKDNVQEVARLVKEVDVNAFQKDRVKGLNDDTLQVQQQLGLIKTCHPPPPQTNWTIIFQVGGDKKRYSYLSLNLNRSETSTTGASISTRDPGWGWMKSIWNSCWELNIWPCSKIGGESKDNSCLQCSMISSCFIPNCKHMNALFFGY